MTVSTIRQLGFVGASWGSFMVVPKGRSSGGAQARILPFPSIVCEVSFFFAFKADP